MRPMKATRDEIEATIGQFTGSQTLTEHWTRKVKYTEGVEYLAESAGAYWLIDVVASYQGHTPALKRCDGFQVWVLDVDLENATGVVTCIPDTDCPPVVTQAIEYTDFPLASIKLWLVGDVLMLPTEY